LLVFEDCAHVFPLQELVARRVTKNFSNIKYLSFGPGKFMTAFGGGALASNDKELSLYLEKNLEKNDQQLQNTSL
jgi:dTDP-4-amino-4,6-dideoxygalactose transaminase